MKLPKLEYPKYKTTLPWSGVEVTYRPYSIKEEKIMTMAASNEAMTEKDAHAAVIQVIENCCGVDVEKLHPSEVEWLFIQLRSVSVSPFLDVIYYNTTCSTEECPDEIETEIDISKSEIVGLDDLKTEGFIQKNGSWIIMLNDSIGLQMKDIKESRVITDTSNMIIDSIVAIFDEENVYPVSDMSKDELVDFIEDVPPVVSDKIKKFFSAQPRVRCSYTVKCPVCGKINTPTVEGLLSFFE